MKLIDRIKALSASIGNDIKAIKAKTNLLKTAAYRDVGTTDGNIPEFVGVNGVGGFGYGGEAIRLDAGSDLDLLPRINAIYTAAKDDNILNRPIELVNYIFEYEFVIECIVGNNANYKAAYIQRLTFDAYPPEGTDTTNPVVFIRSYSYLGFSPWVRLTGKMWGVDVGITVGEDIDVNSIKAGATSPKIAFEIIKVPITYANLGYEADGITGTNTSYDARGALSLRSSIDERNVISMTVNVYSKAYGATYSRLFSDSLGSTRFFKYIFYAKRVAFTVISEAHAIEKNGDTQESGQELFNKDSYVELFITYKVD